MPIQISHQGRDIEGDNPEGNITPPGYLDSPKMSGTSSGALALIIIGFILFFSIIAGLLIWLTYHPVIGTAVAWIVLIALIVFVLYALYALAERLWHWNAHAAIVRDRMLNIVDVHQARKDSQRQDYNMQQLLASYAFQEKIAQYQQFMNVRTYAAGNNSSETLTTQMVPRIEQEPLHQELVPPQQVNKLEGMKQRGLIGRSAENEITLGFDKAKGAVNPASIVPLQLGSNADLNMVAITGNSGSGKTSTVRFYLSQLAMKGSAFVICDPHGKAGEKSLVQSLGTKISSNFLREPAISREEIYSAIQEVDAIGARRIAGEDSSQHITLVIDEFNAVMEKSNPYASQIVTALKHIANQYKKVNITALLLVHNWNASEWRDSSIRNAIQAYVIHNIDDKEMGKGRLDLDVKTMKLGLGEAVYVNVRRNEQVYMRGIPHITSEELDKGEYKAIKPAQALPVAHSATVYRNDEARSDDNGLLEGLLFGGTENGTDTSEGVDRGDMSVALGSGSGTESGSDALIRQYLEEGLSGNEIWRKMGGNRQALLAQIRDIRNEQK